MAFVMLGGRAKFEQANPYIDSQRPRARQAAWREDGCKSKLTEHQKREAIKRLNAGKETQGEIARSYNVSRWTISRFMS